MSIVITHCRTFHCDRKIESDRIMCDNCWAKIPTSIRNELTDSIPHSLKYFMAYRIALEYAST